MSAYARLLLPENLNYAWLKAKNLYRMADGYVDNGELSEFELDLERRLAGIQRQFERGSYRLNALRPLPRPKKIDNDGAPIDRQYYHVNVDDQVAWIAVINALGPELDQRMPAWSYGNRIYRPAWYEPGEDRKSILEIGPYRHASAHLYRKFQHSWPLFRRHVALSARTMVRTTPLAWEQLDEPDHLAVAAAVKENLPYLMPHFWNGQSDTAKGSELYHASIDLKQFYPSLRSDAVLKGLAVAGATDDDRMKKLLADMLRFRIDTSEMPNKTLERVEPRFGRRHIRGVPTGLFVSGFLANVAMLPVDTIVDQRIHKQRRISHFRFVDDHTILGYDFEEVCDWIDWYRKLLAEQQTGAEVNAEKYDPPSLSRWIDARAKSFKATKPPTDKAQARLKEKRDAAIHDTKFDGSSPTKLLTKTLAQVSAIAGTNIEILDDEDLDERLKLLEWLLLADISEREIRPDTRAAFAAGQIASLAPVIVQEADGLIDATRALAALKARSAKLKDAQTEEVESHNRAVDVLAQRVSELRAEHEKGEEYHLRHCFSLLLQAFREYPGKARLFFRLHEYCRVTGFKGLSEIADWINEARGKKHDVWADYYAGLSLQILARGALSAARTCRTEDALRSDREAARYHLEDISQTNLEAFLMPNGDEAWFHAIGRKEFAITLLSVAETFHQPHADDPLHADLQRQAQRCLNVSFTTPSEVWERETARRPGVWANLTESVVSVDGTPSASWKRFEPLFSFIFPPDALAARRYPEFLTDTGWLQILNSEEPLPETDSGWLRDAMKGKNDRIEQARLSKRLALTRAARSLDAPSLGWINLAEWTSWLSTECNPFDPRRSEWTALEILRQIASSIKDIDFDESILDRLHPSNVLISETWKSAFPCQPDRAGMSWKTWRDFVRLEGRRSIKMRDSATSVLDYRYFTETQAGRHLDDWERHLSSMGRLLLGLLRLDHEAPRIWNIRGNEQIFMLPRARWFQALAISSPTLLLMEGCLSGRSAETRAIGSKPALFGWVEGVEANDTDFDPPLLLDSDKLLSAIEHAQDVLEANQLAVAMNQPRQLIPFRLSDFATGPDGEPEEGDGDGE